MSGQTRKPIKRKRAPVPVQIASGLVFAGLILFTANLFVEREPEGCLDVHQTHQTNIALGFTNEFNNGLRLSDFSAVVAEDAIERYFVSATITNNATSDHYGIGTWVLSQVDENSSFYWAMPDLATQITVFPNANEIDSGVRQWNAGYKTSIRCTEWLRENE